MEKTKTVILEIIISILIIALGYWIGKTFIF